MSAPDVCERGAAVLDVDRGLRRALGARAAARIEARPILPVLAVPAGPWSPPAPEALGPETTALVVIHGLLLAADAGGGRVFGPDDRFAPWSGAAQWTACTPLRLAVIGRAFRDALPFAWDPPPGADLRVGDGPLDDRTLALLWGLAHRWGTLGSHGIVLPAGLGRHALALLCAVPEHEVVAVLGRLDEQDRLRSGGRWVLRFRGDGPARDPREASYARMAEQFALARRVVSDYIEISDALEVQRQQMTNGR